MNFKFKGMKFIVTDGAGFIGSNFIYHELDNYPEDEIICLDKLTYAGNLETLELALKNPKFKFVKGDIADRKFVYDLFEKEKPDIIVNFAAESHNVCDWLYVEDHCSAIDLIIRKGEVGEVYNIGGHNEKTNLEVVKTIIKELGKSEDLIEFVTDRPGHDRRYAIDPTKIHNELGWLPATKFNDGIKKTIEWYLTHKLWWKKIISGEYQNYYEKMYKNR